jgi:hypothetical protein
MGEKLFLFSYEIQGSMKDVLRSERELGSRSDVYLINNSATLRYVYSSVFSKPFGIAFCEQCRSCRVAGSYRRVSQTSQEIVLRCRNKESKCHGDIVFRAPPNMKPFDNQHGKVKDAEWFIQTISSSHAQMNV